jgi:hypothetical protein
VYMAGGTSFPPRIMGVGREDPCDVKGTMCGLRSHDATQDCDAGHDPDGKCKHGDSNEHDYKEPS